MRYTILTIGNQLDFIISSKERDRLNEANQLKNNRIFFSNPIYF